MKRRAWRLRSVARKRLASKRVRYRVGNARGHIENDAKRVRREECGALHESSWKRMRGSTRSREDLERWSILRL